jgi:hypothetical protein
VGAVAPYNNQTQYPGNERGDWVVYFRHVLEECGEFDAVTLHCYGRGQVPSDPHSDAKMGGEFGHLHKGFRAYRDFLEAGADLLAGKPVYVTETNPGADGGPWRDADAGWVCAAHDEIAGWNRARPELAVRCLALYRWDTADAWTIRHKNGVRADFECAVAKGIEWPDPPVATPSPSPSPSPSAPPEECRFDEDRLRMVVRQELVAVHEQIEKLPARVRDEVRRLLDATTLKVQ